MVTLFLLPEWLNLKCVCYKPLPSWNHYFHGMLSSYRYVIGSTSHPHALWQLTVSTIMWRKHYYPLLQMKIWNPQTCNLLVYSFTLKVRLSWNSSPTFCLELLLTDFPYSPRHVFMFKTNQKHNVWLTRNHLSSSLGTVIL